MNHLFQICDCVYYGLDSFGRERARWRVKSHLRKQYWEEFLNSRIVPASDVDQIADEIIREIWDEDVLREWYTRLEKGLPANRRFRYLVCRPEEATHLSLYSIGSATAPIGECEFIEVVPWPPERIQEEKESALRRIGGWPRQWEWE